MSGPLGGQPGWQRTFGKGKKRFITKGIKIGSYVIITYRVPNNKFGHAEDAADYEGKIIDKRVGSDDRESYVELKDALRLNPSGQCVRIEKTKRLYDAYIEDCKATEKRTEPVEVVPEDGSVGTPAKPAPAATADPGAAGAATAAEIAAAAAAKAQAQSGAGSEQQTMSGMTMMPAAGAMMANGGAMMTGTPMMMPGMNNLMPMSMGMPGMGMPTMGGMMGMNGMGGMMAMPAQVPMATQGGMMGMMAMPGQQAMGGMGMPAYQGMMPVGGMGMGCGGCNGGMPMGGMASMGAMAGMPMAGVPMAGMSMQGSPMLSMQGANVTMPIAVGTQTPGASTTAPAFAPAVAGGRERSRSRGKS